MSQTEAEPLIQPGPSMMDRAILLQVDLKRLGNSRGIGTDVVAADTDRDMLHVSKTLLDSGELKAIQQLDDKLKAYLRSKCLPSVLRKGVFLLPTVSVTKVNQKLHEYLVQRNALVDILVSAYPGLVEQAQDRLRALFNPDDYPPVDKVASYFSLTWNYVSFGVPEILEEIDPGIFEEQRERAAAQWEEAQNVVRDLLRVRTHNMVKNLTDRMAPGPDGKSKIFRNSLISNIDEFLQDFDALNVTDDHELAQVIGRARDLLSGVDADTLRRSGDLRSSLQSSFSELENQLNTMIVDRPRRGISFDEE